MIQTCRDIPTAFQLYSCSPSSGSDVEHKTNIQYIYLVYLVIDHFWIHPLKWSFFVSDESSYFSHYLVKYDMQQMLILNVTSENVAEVQKLL